MGKGRDLGGQAREIKPNEVTEEKFNWEDSREEPQESIGKMFINSHVVHKY